MPKNKPSPDQRKLAKLEKTIAANLPKFDRYKLVVAKAVEAIFDQKLFQITHRTWKEYCEERWGRHRSWGYRLVNFMRERRGALPLGDIADNLSERHFRELARLSLEGKSRVLGVAKEIGDVDVPKASDIREARAKIAALDARDKLKIAEREAEKIAPPKILGVFDHQSWRAARTLRLEKEIAHYQKAADEFPAGDIDAIVALLSEAKSRTEALRPISRAAA